jgi:hypothetical protein
MLGCISLNSFSEIIRANLQITTDVPPWAAVFVSLPFRGLEKTVAMPFNKAGIRRRLSGNRPPGL